MVLVSLQGSVDEDAPLSSDNPHSLSDLAALTRSDSSHLPAEPHPLGLSFEAKRKLSSSTSDLRHSEGSRLRAKLSQYERSLEDLRRDNAALSEQAGKREAEQRKLEERVRVVTEELEGCRADLEKAREAAAATQDQVDTLKAEKEVAMRDNAESYKQVLVNSTQLKEVLAEKELLVRHQKMADHELEKMASDNVAMKRKLDTIKKQRQQDATDLSTMRVLKDKVLYMGGA